MIRCKNCGTNNIDGSEYCDECGMKLDAYGSPPARPRGHREPPPYQPPSAIGSDVPPSNTMDGPLPLPPSFTTSTSMPRPNLPPRDGRVDSRGTPGPAAGDRLADSHQAAEPPRRREGTDAPGSPPTYAIQSRGRTDPYRGDAAGAPMPEGATARLVIERGGRVGRQFPIVGIETNIGRWDADSGIFPDVDLDEDDPEAKISRRHARIVNHSGQYFIEDLGSTNGTFVNRGRRLLPGKRHMLQNGDEVIVGKTFLKFHILR